MKRLPHKLAALMYPEGSRGIEKLTHRRYIGGNWDILGPLQMDFLIMRGLKPSDYLLDIACGCLRLGVRAIPYLAPGHYMGVEKEPDLIRAGLEMELPPLVREAQSPFVLQSAAFEFDRLPHRPTFAIAQSLFTHLVPETVHACLRNLYPVLQPGGRFYATYVLAEGRTRNPDASHDHLVFRYTRAAMEEFGRVTGFEANYIGEWGHPSGQVMVEYIQRATASAQGRD